MLFDRLAGAKIPGFALRGPQWLATIALGLLYVLSGPLTDLFPHARFGVQPWSAHPAIALVMVVYAGAGAAPILFSAVLASWWLVPVADTATGEFSAALVLTAVYLGAGLALDRTTNWRNPEHGLRDLVGFLAVATILALLVSLVDGTPSVLSGAVGGRTEPVLFLRLFVANLLGLVVLAPLLMYIAADGLRAALARLAARAALRDSVLFLVVQGGILELVFGLRLWDEFRMSYLLFLPVGVVAMRLGLLGAALALPLTQVGMLAALSWTGTSTGTAFEFQLAMLTLSVTALAMGVLADDQRRAAARIAEHELALREHDRALAQAQRTASTAELAAALAHDLSQPLSAIGTYARASQVLAQRGDADRSQLIDTLGRIAQESARAGQYVRRMRDFFRTGVSHQDRIAAADLIGNTYEHLSDRARRARIRWRSRIEPGLPPLRVDAVQMGAVLANLLNNAYDALADWQGPREIRCDAYRIQEGTRTMLRIRVQDTGPGIASEVRERLFTPLATTKPGGMGLGLALSRSITERQEGRLWFDPEAERTTFCLDLPVQDPESPGTHGDT